MVGARCAWESGSRALGNTPPAAPPGAQLGSRPQWLPLPEAAERDSGWDPGPGGEAGRWAPIRYECLSGEEPQGGRGGRGTEVEGEPKSKSVQVAEELRGGCCGRGMRRSSAQGRGQWWGPSQGRGLYKGPPRGRGLQCRAFAEANGDLSGKGPTMETLLRGGG